MQPQEPFVPIDKVAEHFSVSISTVRTWVRQNRIPRDTYVKLGNTYRFQLSAVADALTAINSGEQEEAPLDEYTVEAKEIVNALDLDDFDTDDDI